MSLNSRAAIDTLRSLANSGISGSYAALGGPLLFPARIICITNNTDGDMIFSTDGVNNMLFVAAFSFKLFDVTSNMQAAAMQLTIATGTQFYVKQSTAPSKGAVYLEVIYALPSTPQANTL